MKPRNIYYECINGCLMKVGQGSATYGRYGKPDEKVKCGCCGAECFVKVA